MTPWRSSAPGGLLPTSAGGERWLAVVIGVLCCLACLAAIGAAAADRAADGWARQLRSEATIIVRPRADETPATSAARAAEALAAVTGVEEAAALSEEEARALLRPWLGERLPEDLPTPMLVAVTLDPEGPASAPSLSRALAQAGVDGTVDDHSLWRRGVERSALTVISLAALGFLLTAIAAGAAVAYATQAGVAAAAPVIQVLSLNGAGDATIARHFQRRFAVLTALSATAGTAVAIVAVAVVRLLGGEGGLTPALPVAWRDLWLTLACPPIAFTVAVLAARLAARRAIAAAEEYR